MDNLISLYKDYLKRRAQIGSSDAKFIGLTLCWAPTSNRNHLRSTILQARHYYQDRHSSSKLATWTSSVWAISGNFIFNR